MKYKKIHDVMGKQMHGELSGSKRGTLEEGNAGCWCLTSLAVDAASVSERGLGFGRSEKRYQEGKGSACLGLHAIPSEERLGI